MLAGLRVAAVTRRCVACFMDDRAFHNSDGRTTGHPRGADYKVTALGGRAGIEAASPRRVGMEAR